MANDSIVVKLLADTSGALAEINQFGKAASSTLKTLSGVIGGVFAAGAIGEFAKKSIDAFGELERATNQLKSALEANGKATDANIKKSLEFADAMEKVTRFGDDAIISAEQLLASLTGLSGDGLNRATLAAADLATATGKDLNEAINIVAKAAGGNTAALKKLNVEFKTGKDSAANFESAIAGIEKKFGGRALADAKSFTGQLAILGNVFGNIFEEAGKAIAEVASTTNVLGLVSDNVSLLVTVIQTGLKPSLEIFVSLGASLVDIFAPLGALFGESASGLTGFARVLSTTNTLFQGFVFGIKTIIDSIGFLIKATGILVASFATAGVGIFEFIKALKSGDFSAAKGLFDAAKEGVASIGTEFDKLRDTVVKSAGKSAEATQTVDDGLKNATKSGTKLLDVFKGLGNAKLDTNVKAIDKGIKSQIEALEKELAKVGQTQLQGVQNELNARLDMIRRSGIAESEQNKLIEKARLDARLKSEKIIAENIKNISSNPTGLIGNKELLSTPGAGAAAGVGVLGSALTGAAGAQKLVSGAIGAAADLILPGIGGVVGQIVDVLGQGPDKVREMIQSFTDSIPIILENILKSLPVLIIEISKSIPKILNTLAEELPGVIQSVVEQLPDVIAAILENNQKITAALIKLTLALQKAMPMIATTFAIELAKNAPSIAVSFAVEFAKQAPYIAKALIQAVGSSATGGLLGGSKGGSSGGLGGFTGGGSFIDKAADAARKAAESIFGGGGGGFFGKIGDFFGFASGGVVPGGPPYKDRVPAMLTPGEIVIPRSEASSYNSGPSNVTIKLQVGQADLANVIYNLNRQGYRTS